jgi:tetraacyldisaccharide 4'-kinase
MKTVKCILLPLLWVLSLLYAVAVRVKYYLYKKNILAVKRLPVKVICVGNLTAGGTGKTTTVSYLAGKLASRGYKSVILTRGYKSKYKKKISQIVSDGNEILLSVEEAGDEPYLLAKNLLGNAPVIIGGNRYESGMLAAGKFHPRIILMDDGFQHWELYRDSDIVLVDCLNPFGEGHFLPLGFLREPLSGLRRAKLVILTHCDLVNPLTTNFVTDKIKKIYPGAVIVKSAHVPVKLKNFMSGEPVQLDWLNGRKVATLSSIGNPLAFELTVKSLGPEILSNYRFLDHYWYKGKELMQIFNANQYVITTQKDEVRIGILKDISRDLLSKLFVLNIELKIAEGDEKWLNAILM